MNNLVKIIFFLMFFSFFVGCNPQLLIGPAVTGVIYWVNGEAHQYYEQNTEIVYRATKRALNDLNLPITKDVKDRNGHSIIAGSEDRFSIKIQPTEHFSKLSIRINVLGDKDYAELIYKKVDENISIIEFDPNGNPAQQHGRHKRI